MCMFLGFERFPALKWAGISLSLSLSLSFSLFSCSLCVVDLRYVYYEEEASESSSPLALSLKLAKPYSKPTPGLLTLRRRELKANKEVRPDGRRARPVG